MKKILAVAMLLVFGCFKVTLGQDATPTVAAKTPPKTVHKVLDKSEFTTDSVKIKAEQDAYMAVKATGDYLEAARIAPFWYASAWCYYNAALQQYRQGNMVQATKDLKSAKGAEKKAVESNLGFLGEGKNSKDSFDGLVENLETFIAKAQGKDSDAQDSNDSESGTD